ncbi:MAG: hypothetical protein H6721_02525 [Sandaracinus sp.]|nr:hypothetical protein [Sandaracinus sp.]MCB9631008.1 hypothetical protein [Sandaracinus sp.]
MTRLSWAFGLIVWAFVGCGSDVQICAGGAVCGSDGRTYTDRCAALSADVQVASLGACAVECPVIGCPLACELGFRSGPDGCPTCACAECTTPSDCPGRAACVGGVCMETSDGGVDPDDGGVEPDDGGIAPDDGGVVVTCPPGQEACGEGCADTRTDVAHCGECFEACPTGPGEVSCVDGECTATCRDGLADCNGDLGDGCETDLTTDEDHCGSCDNRCGSSELCLETGCVSGETACRDSANWVVEEESAGACTATCAGKTVTLEGLLGNCGLFSRACTLLNATGTCQQRAARCCFPT